MNAFALRISIDTPIVLSNLLQLDGLLGRLLADRGQAIDEIPLQTIEGIYCGSAALLETGQFGAIETRLNRIKRLKSEGDTILRPLERRRLKDEMSPFRPQLCERISFESVRAIWFCGTGDRDAVAKLTAELRGLGSMCSSGFGRVVHSESYGLLKSQNAGLLLMNGLPARAAPLTLWQKRGFPRHPRAIISRQRYRPPYWTGDEEICISPLLRDLIGTRQEIEGLLGIARRFE